MKKIMLLLSFMLLAIIVKSQVAAVVTDPALLTATTSNWAEQLAIAAKQSEEMYNQSKLMQETIDKYKKVNNTLKNFTMIKKIIDKQVKVLTVIAEARAEFKTNINSQEGYEKFIERLSGFADDIEENMELLNALFTDGLSMTDYERLQMAMNIDEKSTSTLQSVKSEINRYKEFNDNIENIQNLIKK